MYRTSGQEDTFALGCALGDVLLPGDCVLLCGELGAGKSVLARGIARALGVEEPMPSPTFTLMQPYVGRLPVCHFDLYRLSDADEFYAAGLEEYVGGAGIALIEWPLPGLDYGPALHLSLARGAGPDERVIALDCADLSARGAAVVSALKQWEASE